MGKSSMNKRKQLENHKLTCDDIGPSMSAGKLLTQEEAEREALAISIYERYSIRGGEICRDDIQNMQKKITKVNHSKAELMGLLRNVMCQVGVTTIIAEFLILDMPIDRDTLILVGRGVLHTCGGILNTIKRITSTFDETMGTYADKAESSRPKRSRQYKTVKEVLLPQVHHEFLQWEG
nr:hypothetical protein [Tanacetum cinerariifolium]